MYFRKCCTYHTGRARGIFLVKSHEGSQSRPHAAKMLYNVVVVYNNENFAMCHHTFDGTAGSFRMKRGMAPQGPPWSRDAWREEPVEKEHYNDDI